MLVDGAVRTGHAVLIEADRIRAVVADSKIPTDAHVTELPGRLLLPGFVNAHSHAFQLGLRRTPQVYGGTDATFWSWRETMYALVQQLDPTVVYELSKRAFGEMLRRGITAVGEFHYVHHADDAHWVLDDAVIEAARDTGIRLALLQVHYETGDIGRPLSGAQARFDARSMGEFAGRLETLGARLDRPTESLGIACHSVRACTPESIAALAERARTLGCPLHMHLEEQLPEIERCTEAYGVGPVGLALRHAGVDDRFCAVHCTHTTRQDLQALLGAGANICLCPLTEGNLADGVADLPTMLDAARDAVCLGTDSNIRIDPVEEARFLEFGQRKHRERCGIATDEAGRCSAMLHRMATKNGARALGLDAGHIAAGSLADLIAVDDADFGLAEHPGGALDALMFGASGDDVREVWVGGKLVHA